MYIGNDSTCKHGSHCASNLEWSFTRFEGVEQLRIWLESFKRLEIILLSLK